MKLYMVAFMVIGAIVLGVVAQQAYAATHSNKKCPSSNTFSCPVLCVGAGSQICGETITTDYRGEGINQKQCELATPCDTCTESTSGCRYKAYDSVNGTCTGSYTQKSFNCWQLCG